MCTHLHYIFNPYSRRKVLVPCGKCEACLQEKAFARANRIRNNVTDGTIALFITLTYANDYVPYVLRSDLCGEDAEINVYRNSTVRFVYNPHSKKYFLKKDVGVSPISRYFVPFEVRGHTVYNDVVSGLKGLNGLSKNHIGVCLYSDVQKFYKRLRQILFRHYGFQGKFSYFTCSELGGYSHRPHFHALLFIRPDYEEIFRSAIVEAWPYADKSRTAKYIEIARDAASYVASYVNSNLSLPPLMQEDMFKPKHSFSKDFGVVLDCFSLPKILEKIDKGDLFYYRRQKFDGESSVTPVSIPVYVLNRYFPKHKGFGWLAPHQLLSILRNPEKVGDVFSDREIISVIEVDGIKKEVCYKTSPKVSNPLYHFSSKETYRIYVSLENAYQRFYKETGLSRFDYADYYVKAWRLHSIQSIKQSLLNVELFKDWSDFYENVNQFDNFLDVAPTLENLDLERDPNNRSDIVLKSNRFTVLFDKLDKQKKVTNYVMSYNKHNV